MCKFSSYLNLEVLKLEIKYVVQKVLKRSVLRLLSSIGVSKDWTQGKNVHSLTGLVGEGIC